MTVEDDPLASAYNRGLAHEAEGDIRAAAEAYREALRLDPADHGGVSVRLAAIGAEPAPDKAPDAYVTTLFDQHAESFDEILVDRLGYRVPEMVAEAIGAHAPGPYASLLDLGCGTGLTGLALAPCCDRIVGVDLSEEMLARADERGVYDQLFVGDVVQFLEEEEDRFDLIAATDVLPYLGALERFFAGLSTCLTPGGVVALSSETLAEGDWAVGRKHRFAHSTGYLLGLLESCRIEVLLCHPITVRMEETAPVPGELILARAS